MKLYFMYDTNGRILFTGSVGKNTNLDDMKLDPSHGYIVGQHAEGDTHWYNAANGQVEQRVSSVASWDKLAITADGIDEATLSGLPVPCTVFVDGAEILVEDGSFEFSADDQGEYKIWIDEVGYLRQEWMIDAD